MRKAAMIMLAAVFTLVAPIGSGGTGTMTPLAMHVDRHVYAAPDGSVMDLRAVDAMVLAAVRSTARGANGRQD